MRHQSNGAIGGGQVEYIKPFVRGIGYLGAHGSHVDKKPVPPLSEYEAYQQTLDSRCRKAFQPAKVRRIVIMMRNAENFYAAGKLIGYRMGRDTYDKMPDHLK